MRSFVLEREPYRPQPSEAGRYCPTCGYDQNGASDISVEGRCPECGSQWSRDALLPAPPLGPMATIVSAALKVAVGVTVVGGLWLSLAMPSIGRTRCCGRAPRAATVLQIVHHSLSAYAKANGGSYPVHAASLIPLNYFTPELFEDPRFNTGQVLVGQFALNAFDYSASDEQALTTAIQSTDLQAPFYQLGDYWITRLAQSTNDPRLIAAWAQPDKSGQRVVVFDDSHTDTLPQETWQAAWQADALARVQLKLPPVPAPP